MEDRQLMEQHENYALKIHIRLRSLTSSVHNSSKSKFPVKKHLQIDLKKDKKV